MAIQTKYLYKNPALDAQRRPLADEVLFGKQLGGVGRARRTKPAR